MNAYSDSESVYSFDSLEDVSKIKEEGKVNLNNTKKCSATSKNVTISCYKGLLENVKTNSGSKTRNSPVPPTRSNSERKEMNSCKEETNKQTDNQATSYFWNNTPSKQYSSKQRISRRKELVVESSSLPRARHRSVSYLEQFRKKNYKMNSLDSSSCSIASSKLSTRDTSLSFMSCLSGESRTSTSEFEFYDDLIMSSGYEPITWNKEIQALQSSTLLMEKAPKSTKPGKFLQQSKVKPVILTRIEVTIPDQQKSELEKKRSIEKREIYANKVKLRNQIKINRQKEREKYEKFHSSIVLSSLTSEECILQPQANNDCFTATNRNKPPLKETIHERKSKNESLVPPDCNNLEKSMSSLNRRRGKLKNNKKTSELFKLQERHKKEKSLIESMRNLILKT